MALQVERGLCSYLDEGHHTMRPRIAIVGAGIAGLHAARYLEGYGDVEIFEASAPDEHRRPLQMEGALNQFDFTPQLEPIHRLEHNILHAPHRRTVLHGDLGQLFKIGGHEGIDARMRRAVASAVPIHYGQPVSSLEELSEYDVVIGADGWRASVARMAGMRETKPYQWGAGLGATVTGAFTPGRMETVIDNRYAPNGYLYMIPLDERRATLAAAVVGYQGGSYDMTAIRQRLRRFTDRRDLTVIDEWVDHEMWYRFHTYKKDNVYLIGGGASFTDEALGYGLKYAVWSARLCARAIRSQRSYHRLLQPLLRELAFWHRAAPHYRLRRAQQDTIVRLQGMPPVKQLIQHGVSIKPFVPLLPVVTAFS